MPIQTTVKMEMVKSQSILEVENNSLLGYYQREEGEKYFKPNEGGHKGSSSGRKRKRRNPWGEKSYADLITWAILSSPNKRLTLAEIYNWIKNNIPYFRERADTAGWKVSKNIGVKLSLDCSNFALTGDN